MSQKYTEVEWQDPAGGNPGTLINKARLDQMQTAHHYADGFEEVDAVPTANPGVSYHKIVYCTADNTLYRWDGTQWTADIDDPTRELLEEHEADHANPHEVTKAQVGLGNCDNTSDADKPVSTATQTALNAKADKSTTLAGYGITDAYTKSQADTLLGAKADKATTYTKTETDTLLAGKADASDTYTKTEADTLLSAKADDNAVVKLTGNQTVAGLKTYYCGTDNLPYISHTIRNQPTVASSGLNRYAAVSRITATDGAVLGELRLGRNTSGQSYLMAHFVDGGGTIRDSSIATMADIDGYLPMVRTTGNQDIAGIKTFTGAPAFNASTTIATAKMSRKITDAVNGNTYSYIDFLDEAGSRIGVIGSRILTNPNGLSTASRGVYLQPGNQGNLYVNTDGTTLTAGIRNQRSYDTSNTEDIVTIGTLKASTDVVHRSGAETITDLKTFYATGFSEIAIKSARTGEGNIGGLGFFNAEGNRVGQFYGATDGSIILDTLQTSANASVKILHQRAYNAISTTDVATIGTLDAYTPMVRTSGNQTISGLKKFQTIVESHKTGNTSPCFASVRDDAPDLQTPRYILGYSINTANGDWVSQLEARINSDGTTSLWVFVRNSDGSPKYVELAKGNVIA